MDDSTNPIAGEITPQSSHGDESEKLKEARTFVAEFRGGEASGCNGHQVTRGLLAALTEMNLIGEDDYTVCEGCRPSWYVESEKSGWMAHLIETKKIAEDYYPSRSLVAIFGMREVIEGLTRDLSKDDRTYLMTHQDLDPTTSSGDGDELVVKFLETSFEPFGRDPS